MLHRWCTRHHDYLPVWQFNSGRFNGYANNCALCCKRMKVEQQRREGRAYTERKSELQRQRRARRRTAEHRENLSQKRVAKVRRRLGIVDSARELPDAVLCNSLV